MGSSVHYNLMTSDSDSRSISSVAVGSNECLDDTCTVSIITAGFTSSVSIQLTLTAVNIAGTTINQQDTQICKQTYVFNKLNTVYNFSVFRSNKCMVLSAQNYISKLFSSANWLFYVNKRT